jgi:hypothetical protein
MAISLIDPQRFHDEFDANVSMEVQQAIVRGVGDGYARTWSKCEADYEDECKLQAWQYSRWNAIDSALLAVGKRFKSAGVSASFILNTEGSVIRHTELRVGKFIMTAAAVLAREDSPRPAAYRDLLAESNEDVYSLFTRTRPKSPSTIWVPLLHIPDIKTKMPRAIFAAFPDKDYNFACEHIDLLARFPLVGNATETIRDMANPTMRTAVGKGS